MSDYTISMRIQLKEGMNEIQMILRASGSGPNIDALKLITEAQLTWTPEVNGGAPIATHEYNVDDVWQGDINETPERLQFTINGEVIDYAPFTVKGHTRLPEASPNSQYGLFADYLLTTELVLEPGENVITMTVLVMGAGTNVDALKIYTDAELTWVPTQNNDAPIADYGFNVASFPEQA